MIQGLMSDHVEQIHSATEDILENVGVQVQHDVLLQHARRSGAKVDEVNGQVRIPRSMLKELLALIPSSYTICGVDGRKNEVKNASRYWLGSVILPRTIDYQTGRPRLPTLEDARRNNIVAQKIDAIKAIYRMEVPVVDFKDETSSLRVLEEYILNNAKHIYMFASSLELFDRYLDIGRMICETRNLPLGNLMSISIPVVTPLKMPELHSDLLIRSCAEGFAVQATTCPIAGATGPYSLASNLVLSNAENLFLAALVQILRPGNPFIYTFANSVLDLHSGQAMFYTLNKVLCKIPTVQMARFYRLPSIVDCAGTMNPRFDIQSGGEGMAFMLAAYAAGPSWMGAVGVHNNALGYSSEMLLIQSAWYDASEFFNRGMRIDSQRLGVENIKKAGPGGNFITDDLTLQFMHGDEFFSNDLFDISAYDMNSPSMLERAHEKVELMVGDFESPVPGDLQEKLRRYFHDQYK